MREDIIYSNDTLYVYLDGNMNRRKLKKLRSKVESIINEYPINDIVFDTKNLEEYNDKYFDNLVSNYDSRLNIKLK